jgi:hypothetical protein
MTRSSTLGYAQITKVFIYFFKRLYLARTASLYTLLYSTNNTTIILHSDNHASWGNDFLAKSNLKPTRIRIMWSIVFARQLTVPHTDGYFQNRRLFTYSLLLNNDIRSNSTIRLHAAFYYARQQKVLLDRGICRQTVNMTLRIWVSSGSELDLPTHYPILRLFSSVL